MAKSGKQEAINALRALGEEPPKMRTTMEIKTRIIELEMERGIIRKSGKAPRTNMREWMAQLNKASKKKAALQEFCVNTLQLTITGNETIAILQQKATEKIYQISSASSQDPMGFGKHSTKTYGEVLANHPDYVRWGQQQMEEGEASVRLSRFIMWATKQEAPETSEPPTLPKPVKYQERMEVDGHLSPGSASRLIKTVETLKQELADLKEELPHKKVPAAESDGSFQMM